MKQNEENTSDLLTALIKGDESAFKSIYDNHKKELSAFINNYTKNQAQTDDIVQETFITLWKKKENLDSSTSIISYLCRTAYNSFIDKYRRKKRERLMLDGWLYKRLMEMEVEDNHIKKEKIKIVRESIEKLPPKCKEIFLLSKFENIKYSEIAERLDISVKTVEAQMRNAFIFIRKEVKRRGFLSLFILFMKQSFKKRFANSLK